MLFGSNGNDDDAGSGSKSRRRAIDPEEEIKIPFVVLAVFLFIGSGLIAAAVLWFEEGIHKILAEHMGSAFVVASLIGFTYEWLVHRKRDKWIRMFADEQRRATDEALNAFVATTPREIFHLLRDIATRVGKIPTLYAPAREEGNEYTFAGSIYYFQSLVAARRSEVIEVLREWIREESDPKLKFLASDFIGEFQLQELREELESQIHLEDWDKMKDDYTKGWQLNYAWAASRANQKNMYVSLAGIARKTPFEEIEKWILFIPKQMKDREFLRVINAYLRRDDLNTARMALVVQALVELRDADSTGVRETFKKFRDAFNRPEVIKEIENTWRRHTLSPEPIIKLIEKGGRKRQDVTGTA